MGRQNHITSAGAVRHWIFERGEQAESRLAANGENSNLQLEGASAKWPHIAARPND